MKPFGCIFCCCPQAVGKFNILPPVAFAVINCPVFNRTMKHFFKANRLSAQLYLKTPVMLQYPAFIFNGKDLPKPFNAFQGNSFLAPAKFHNIRHTAKSKPIRCQPQPADNPQIRTGLTVGTVDIVVEIPAFGGKNVFLPNVLYVNQSTPPLTEH